MVLHNWHVYALCEPGTGEIRYIGKTKDLEARLKMHCSEHASPAVRDWIASLGEPPTIRSLETSWSQNAIDALEKELIAKHAGPRLLNKRAIPDPPPQREDFVGFGERIMRRRAELGISQVGLARAVGLDNARLSRLENGKCQTIGVHAAVRLARALSTTVEHLVTGAA